MNRDDILETFASPFLKIYTIQYLFGVIGFFLHFWTTWVAFEYSGIWWTVLHFMFFIYAEFYWAYQIWLEQGANLYSVIVGSWAIIYVTLLILTIVLNRKTK